MTIRRFETGVRMSRAVTQGGVAYLAGLTADDFSLDVSGQTRQVLEKAEQKLALLGSNKSRLLGYNLVAGYWRF